MSIISYTYKITTTNNNIYIAMLSTHKKCHLTQTNIY